MWTTVVAKDCYTETVNQQTHTVYELTLIADGRDNQFKLRVDKPTYDRAFINNKSNRLSFNLNRSDYGTGWEPLIVGLLAKLVDAPDLSSGVQKWTCGFESHSSH